MGGENGKTTEELQERICKGLWNENILGGWLKRYKRYILYWDILLLKMSLIVSYNIIIQLYKYIIIFNK